jgi:hypothetical protein
LDNIGEGMNPRWLENKILEMAQDIKDLKAIMKTVNSPPPVKETKYPINKGK